MVKPIEDQIKSRTRKIPTKFVREVIKGKPYYYKGYKNVLNGSKKIEEIMGSSSLQSILVMIIGFFIKSKIDKSKYLMATNEAGLHFGNKNNYSTDIGIFKRENLSLNDKYFEVAPEIAIEVDVKVDNEDLDYIFSKSEEMMNFGTQKVLWIITKNKKVMVFSKGENAQIYDWQNEVSVMDGISLNIQELIKEEGLEELIS